MEDLSPEELAVIRRRLRGRPLRSRPVQLLKPVAFTAGCAVALIAVLEFAEGLWMVVALLVWAFVAGHIPEAFAVSKHSVYRKEWELANSSDPEPQKQDPHLAG